MKPVLLVDNEVAAEGDSYLESTLGTKGSFTINLTSGGRNTSVTNDVTTGSMYAVTLDSQNITAEELQSVYDEAAALRDSVTEANVYSEEYLGKLLSLAGKLYFAQVDIADTLAADMYDVAVTRSLSEGITGYEVRTSSMYGRITSLSEGNLYIDIDTDSHGVVSLNGEEDVVKEYMSSTGMTSSLYESAVWEELTGYESVSTISILAKAQEENIDILLISSINLGTEIEKLNTDEATRQSVINAVNRGMVVTIPAEEITMGEWTGTGYIVTNPATGAGEYIISGGLNGGSVVFPATFTLLAGLFYTIVELAGLFASIIGIVYLMAGGLILLPLILLLLTGVSMVIVVDRFIGWELAYLDFVMDNDVDAAYRMMYEFAHDVKTDAKIAIVFGGLLTVLKYTEWKYGINIGAEINKLLRKLTSKKIQNIIEKYGISIEAFSDLLQYDRALSKEERELVDAVRDEIGIKPEKGTKMAKVIPETEIPKYLEHKDYTGVQGYVSKAEFSENLKTLDEVFEGNRLDYAGTKFHLSDDSYGKIIYSYNGKTDIVIPRSAPTAADYPYTGKGFTASKNVILPEWKMQNQEFVEDDILQIIDSKTGDIIETYIFDGVGSWVKQ